MSRVNLLVDLVNAQLVKAVGMPQWARALKAGRARERQVVNHCIIGQRRRVGGR